MDSEKHNELGNITKEADSQMQRTNYQLAVRREEEGGHFRGGDEEVQTIDESVVSLFVAQLCPTLFDPMDCTCQSPLSMGFSRQE